MADPMEMITLAQAGGILGAGVVATGVIAKIINWAVGLRRELDEKAPRSDCDRCRMEMREALEKKASKSEVIAHAATLGEQRESLAVIRTELTGLGRRFDELRDMLKQLLERGDR